MTDPFVSRIERFGTVPSTQDVVAGWLAGGVPEVCVAVADVQETGRGRQGRSWEAPSGAGLLVSCGFRPGWLTPAHAWRLPAIVALAMADAAEEVAGLRDGRVGLKWPNDLVADDLTGALLKLAGVLGVTSGDGRTLETAIVGVGVNVQWPRATFPAAFTATMTSLSELSGRPVDRDALLEGFLDRLAARHEALRTGQFDAGGWAARQQTTGRQLTVDTGGVTLAGRGEGVDPESGALVLATGEGIARIDVGEVVRCHVLG
jgi:BirA family biotin operon repressor/biotin-[acetyl-CoA-carboxylase] ligase